MSRRESRASLSSRQNDALFEFESFKKKFLLANKHITKLNSTLSVRIEELNAQISSLYVENLRLRASEIALAAQLKREKEKSRKVMAEAEAATLNLTKHLNYLRQSLNIPEASSPSPPPPSPRARKPPPPDLNSPVSPLPNRIARAPNVPGIYEEEEPLPSSSEHDPEPPAKSPGRRKSTKSKPRLSASKLPLPTRTSTPPPPPLPPIPAPPSSVLVDLSALPSTKRKSSSRRQSGLLTVHTEGLAVPRPASPAFGSPIRLQAGRAEEEEEQAIAGELLEEDAMDVDVYEKKEKRRGRKNLTTEMDEEDMGAAEVGTSRGGRSSSKRQRDEDDGTDVQLPKLKLKDVTNSRSALQPIGNTVHEEEPSSSSRPFLTAGTESTSTGSRRSTSPVPPPEGDSAPAGGRERRVRKSVNYAEPKLNTKMRKPDPPPGEMATRKKRSSAAAIMVTSSSSSSRKSIPTAEGDEADNDTAARSSLEQPALPLRTTKGGYVDPSLFPLPPSRPTSSIAGSYSPGPPAKSSSSSSSSSSGVRKRKSKPQMFMDEEESDGAEADGEYVPPGQRGWVERRKASGSNSGGSGSGASRRVLSVVSGDEARRGQEVDGRRHSLAV